MDHKWVICGSHPDCFVGQWVKWVIMCDPLSTLVCVCVYTLIRSASSCFLHLAKPLVYTMDPTTGETSYQTPTKYLKIEDAPHKVMVRTTGDSQEASTTQEDQLKDAQSDEVVHKVTSKAKAGQDVYQKSAQTTGDGHATPKPASPKPGSSMH